MRTPRRPRLSRRQSEQLLDSLDGPDDLVRLLELAGRPPAAGELPGEPAALAAFRSCAATSAESPTRSLPVRTLSLNRGLVVKVLTTTTAAIAFGGVAFAATGHLPAPKLPSEATAAHGTASPTRSPGADRDALRTGTPAAAPSDDAKHHGEAARYIGLCRAWSESTKHTTDALARSTAFRELAASAGGADKVTAYCEDVQKQWCSDHRWPLTASARYSGRPYPFRCLPPRPTGSPSEAPSDPPRSAPPAPASDRPTTLPSKQPPIVRPTVEPNVQPTGGPVRD